jgi:hypothetical protein
MIDSQGPKGAYSQLDMSSQYGRDELKIIYPRNR